jgi:hypothetical protein
MSDSVWSRGFRAHCGAPCRSPIRSCFLAIRLFRGAAAGSMDIGSRAYGRLRVLDGARRCSWRPSWRRVTTTRRALTSQISRSPHRGSCPGATSGARCPAGGRAHASCSVLLVARTWTSSSIPPPLSGSPASAARVRRSSKRAVGGLGRPQRSPPARRLLHSDTTAPAMCTHLARRRRRGTE